MASFTLKDKVIEIDDEDDQRVSTFTWHLGQNKGRFYVRRSICLPRNGGKQKILKQYLHQFILGDPPEGHVICFKDNNRLNCRKSNLFFASISDKTHISNRVSVGYRRQSGRKRYEARIADTVIGYYDKEDDAKQAYSQVKSSIIHDIKI